MTAHRLLDPEYLADGCVLFCCSCGAESPLCKPDAQQREIPLAVYQMLVRTQAAPAWFARHLAREAEIDAAWARRHELRKAAIR